MKNLRSRKPATIDADHMRSLHEEAIAQLELMHSALDAAERATGTMRDNLDNMALDHWRAYLDVVHMVTLHDGQLAEAMKRFGTSSEQNEDPEALNRQYFSNRLLLALLVLALICRHRRFWNSYGWRGNPMGDYLNESLIMERKHIAELVSMIQSIT